MATVRPISPQYQHTLDSAISLAKELASKNMAESGESSPKTPNSPDKKRFSFKLKHFAKSFGVASANIRDIESSISYEAKQAYKSLVVKGPYNYHSNNNHNVSNNTIVINNNSNQQYQNQHHLYLNNHNNHHHTIGPAHMHHNQYANDDFSPSFTNRQ